MSKQKENLFTPNKLPSSASAFWVWILKGGQISIKHAKGLFIDILSIYITFECELASPVAGFGLEASITLAKVRSHWRFHVARLQRRKSRQRTHESQRHTKGKKMLIKSAFHDDNVKRRRGFSRLVNNDFYNACGGVEQWNDW